MAFILLGWKGAAITIVHRARARGLDCRSYMDFSRVFDVLVLGGGNAALCAALAARRCGASVLMVEAAPVHFRGGNSRHTRNLRCMHDAPADVLTDAYPEEEYWQDLLKVTGGLTRREARAAWRSATPRRAAHG